MSENESNISFKKLLSIMSKPYSWIIPTAATIVGLNVFGIISVMGAIASHKEFFDNHSELLLGILFAMVILVILGFLFLSVTLSIAILRIKPFKEKYEENIVNCANNCVNCQKNLVCEQSCLEKLKNVNDRFEGYLETLPQQLSHLDLAIGGLGVKRNIINQVELMEIEKKMTTNTEIIIFSSQNKLDEIYKQIIVENILKGVTYKYIVVGANSSSSDHRRFMEIVKKWYDEYEHLSAEKKGEYASKKAKGILPKSMGKKVDSKAYFLDHVKEYCSPFAYNILTIMLYQKPRSNGEYQVIVNLPVDNDNYYSYILPDNSQQTKAIVNGVLNMCLDQNEHIYWRD